jgi:hypothetical protein
LKGACVVYTGASSLGCMPVFWVLVVAAGGTCFRGLELFVRKPKTKVGDHELANQILGPTRTWRFQSTERGGQDSGLGPTLMNSTKNVNK